MTRLVFPLSFRLTAAALLAVGAAMAYVPAGAADQDKHSGAPPPLTILAFGDSLVAGFGLDDPSAAFPFALARRLSECGVDSRAIQGGVSGDTTAGGRRRLTWSLTGPEGRPDLALVALGANDMLRGLSPQTMQENLAAIVTGFATADVPVLLAGVTALGNWGTEMKTAYRDAFAGVARDHDLLFIPDLLAGVAGTAALNQADGIHPNVDGIGVMVATVLPYIDTFLQQRDHPGVDPSCL